MTPKDAFDFVERVVKSINTFSIPGATQMTEALEVLKKTVEESGKK